MRLVGYEEYSQQLGSYMIIECIRALVTRYMVKLKLDTCLTMT